MVSQIDLGGIPVKVVKKDIKNVHLSLGGHLKTGHRGSLQNRPTAAART